MKAKLLYLQNVMQQDKQQKKKKKEAKIKSTKLQDEGDEEEDPWIVNDSGEFVYAGDDLEDYDEDIDFGEDEDLDLEYESYDEVLDETGCE